jgi:hypothetical protein
MRKQTLLFMVILAAVVLALIAGAWMRYRMVSFFDGT